MIRKLPDPLCLRRNGEGCVTGDGILLARGLMKNWRIEFESGEAVYITSESSIVNAISRAQMQALEITGLYLNVIKAEQI